MYVVLALFMLMEIIQKATLRSYFQKNYILAAPVLFLWTGLNQSAITRISVTVMLLQRTRDLPNFQNLTGPVPSQHKISEFVHFRHHNKNGRNCVVTCEAIVEKRPHVVDE
jgi:hypothetical protein